MVNFLSFQRFFLITSIDRQFSWKVIYTDTIHHAILFIETVTMYGTTKPIS